MEYKALVKFHHSDNEKLAGNFSLDFLLCFFLAVCKQDERGLEVPAFYVIIILDFDPIKAFCLFCFFNFHSIKQFR